MVVLASTDDTRLAQTSSLYCSCLSGVHSLSIHVFSISTSIKHPYRSMISSSFSSLHNTSFSFFWRIPRLFFIPPSSSLSIYCQYTPVPPLKYNHSRYKYPRSFFFKRPNHWDRPVPYARNLPPFIGQVFASCLSVYVIHVDRKSSQMVEKLGNSLAYVHIQPYTRTRTTRNQFFVPLDFIKNLAV